MLRAKPGIHSEGDIKLFELRVIFLVSKDNLSPQIERNVNLRLRMVLKALLAGAMEDDQVL